MRIELDITKDELAVLLHLVNVANDYSSDPLKDIYEIGDDAPAEPYAALSSMAEKLNAAAPQEVK